MGDPGDATLDAVSEAGAVRVRREPPVFQPVVVARVERPVPGFVRVTLAGWAPPVGTAPAASIRVLLPSLGAAELVMPTWRGNEFLLPSGERPVIRTLTPLAADPGSGASEASAEPCVTVAVFLHEGGAASAWASSVGPGAEVAVSGPGRGYPVDDAATLFVVAGDESALPAMGQVLAALPVSASVRVLAQARPDARLPLKRDVAVEWCDDVAEAVTALGLPGEARVWAAGEASAMQRIRKHLFDTLGLPRSQTWVRGYWKHGRAGGGDD
jgi:NADPH-dependent ferric siderophore reductase